MGILNKMVDIGAMDRQVTIHYLTYTTGAAGEQVPGTETSETIWAKIEWSGGDEKEESGRLEMNTRMIVTIRYYSGITNKYWIEYDSEEFDIVNIQEIGRQRFHRLTTEKRV